MVLEMPPENRQCQGRGNMGGKLIPDLGCSGWKRFWSGHWCFPQWCKYGYRRGRPEWSWRCVPWKNLSKVQRLLVLQYLESSCGNFETDSMAYREPVQAGQNWRDVAVPRLLCNNSSKGVLKQLKASKIWCGCACKKRITVVKARADYWSHLIHLNSLLRSHSWSQTYSQYFRWHYFLHYCNFTIDSKLDYCNSHFLNLSCQQTNRLQLILNSAARVVTKTPKYNHVTSHLKYFHWLKITQRIQYKILLHTTHVNSNSLLDLLKIQPTHSTRSSAVITLQRPSNPYRLKITDRSFLLPPSSCSLEFTASTSAGSFFSITYSNKLFSPLTVFLSFPQTTENLPFPSILSSLHYLLPGLTLRNSSRPAFARRSHSMPFIIHRTGMFSVYMMSTVYWNKLAEIHFCQLYVALKIFLILSHY